MASVVFISVQSLEISLMIMYINKGCFSVCMHIHVSPYWLCGTLGIACNSQSLVLNYHNLSQSKC